MDVGVELRLTLLHDFALERWRERTDVAKLYDAAVFHMSFRNFGGKSQYGFHFGTGECRCVSHLVTETAMVDAFAPCGACLKVCLPWFVWFLVLLLSFDVLPSVKARGFSLSAGMLLGFHGQRYKNMTSFPTKYDVIFARK